MGHLINPISLQIKYHGSWKISWSQYLRKDFGFFFFLENYFKRIIQSIVQLKSYFNKFFMFELKYFIKNNIIFFFFSLKFIRKTRFAHYWRFRSPKYKFKLNPKEFTKRSRIYTKFLKSYASKNFKSYSITYKEKFFHKLKLVKYIFAC